MKSAYDSDMDNMALNNIRERNISRVREIDAVLGELLPVVSRLQRERMQCTDTVSRINVNSTPDKAPCGDQCANNSGSATPDPIVGMFIIDANTKNT